MSFCSYSGEFTRNMFTSVENQFITKYLPQANGDAVRVYLYGLYLCQCEAEFDAESASKLLKIPMDKLIEIFGFWEDCDLVHILSRNPLFVQYLPVNAAIGKPKPIRPEKYAEFNRELYRQLQKAGKEFKPYEIQKILEFLENNPMEQQAFLLVSDYCVKKDGNKLTAAHVLNKAAKLCKEHKFTYEQVEHELSDFGSLDKEKALNNIVFAVSRKLGLKVENPRAYDDYAEKWLERGYDADSLSLVASVYKELGYRFAEMDTLLDGLYRDGIVESGGVKEHCAVRQKQLKLLQKIQTLCGVVKKSQNTLDMIATWWNWNFSDAMILEAAARSANASAPIPYMNKLLSEWKRLEVYSVSEIPERTAPAAQKNDYRSEAAIAADERTERERHYAILRQRAAEEADKALALALKDE
ncbi:MAG: hypothetical protein K2N74_02375, partial [Clostridiales bacterium]|nr:hypothetical protein [Clostridiales bacterium]